MKAPTLGQAHLQLSGIFFNGKEFMNLPHDQSHEAEQSSTVPRIPRCKSGTKMTQKNPQQSRTGDGQHLCLDKCYLRTLFSERPLNDSVSGLMLQHT